MNDSFFMPVRKTGGAGGSNARKRGKTATSGKKNNSKGNEGNNSNRNRSSQARNTKDEDLYSSEDEKYHSSNKRGHGDGQSSQEDNNSDDDNGEEEEEEEDMETPAEKRVRLAREYLEKIQQKDEDDVQDGENSDDPDVAERLKREQEKRDRRIDHVLAHTYVDSYRKENELTLRDHDSTVTCVAISQDERYVYSGSKDSSIIKWCSKTGKKLLKAAGGRNLNKMNKIKDKKNNNNNISNMYNAKSAKFKSKFRGHVGHVLALAVSSDGKYLASGGEECKIFIWDTTTMKVVHVFKGHKDIVTGLVFRQGSNTLYSCSFDRTVKIWNIDSMAFVEQLYGHQDHIMAIDTLSRERAVSVGGREKSVRYWKIVEESQLCFSGHKGNIECVKMINENMWATCGEDGTILMWTSFKKRPFFTQSKAHAKKYTKTSIENNNNDDDDDESNKDSSMEDILSDDEEEKEIEKHNNNVKKAVPTTSALGGSVPWVNSLACLRYSDLMASGSSSGEIKLWKIESNKTLSNILNIPVVGVINSMCFAQSGNFLVAGVGKEHRLGRWESMSEAKNCIKIFHLTPSSTTE